MTSLVKTLLRTWAIILISSSRALRHLPTVLPINALKGIGISCRLKVELHLSC